MGMRVFAASTAALAAGVIAVGTGVALASSTGAAARTVTARSSASGTRKSGSATTQASAASPDVRVREGICTAPPAYRALAAKLSADITGALRGRPADHGVTVYDAVTGVSCYTNSTQHMDSASIVKTIILAALLRWHQETGKPLSSWEKGQAKLMITESDNDAATALWDEVGMTRLQQFLDQAKMSDTQLGQDGYWGLTQVTARDEMLLLELLALPNAVLSNSSRSYELGLMSQVIPSQRWGTPAGAPSDVTVHVKNGWLGDASGWHVNSLGVFTGKDKNYMMAVLTTGNSSEQYGIDTIEDVARVVHRDLNNAKLTAG